MTLRLAVVSVLALALLCVPRLCAQDLQADAVLKAREAALAAGDVDAILRLFADDAVVVTMGRPAPGWFRPTVQPEEERIRW